jgi:hypothetical protein
MARPIQIHSDTQTPAALEVFPMMQENEIIGRTLGTFGKEGNALLGKLSKSEVSELRVTLAHFLVSAANENACVTASTVELPSGNDFKSILYRTAKTNRILTFAFKDAAVEALFPILGIALSIYTGTWGVATIPEAGGVLKTLWSKLVVLKRPEDADAIDVVNAIVRVRAQHVLDGSNEHPTSLELETNSGLSKDALIAALKTLRSRGVIEASSWVAQTDDMTQQGNRWRIKL